MLHLYQDLILQTLICVWSKKPQLQKYCKLSLVCKKWHGKIYNMWTMCIKDWQYEYKWLR